METTAAVKTKANDDAMAIWKRNLHRFTLHALHQRAEQGECLCPSPPSSQETQSHKHTLPNVKYLQTNDGVNQSGSLLCILTSSANKIIILTKAGSITHSFLLYKKNLFSNMVRPVIFLGARVVWWHTAKTSLWHYTA